MTDAELDELLADCPSLFHMAEAGSWPSIRRHGLLSTSALLDLYGVEGTARAALEDRRRPGTTRLRRAGLDDAVVRDQKPMDDPSLLRCLQDGLRPVDWYRLLNGKVFFCLSRRRLDRMLGARSYRTRAHDVIELRSRPLVERYRHAITLCPINSGATRPFPAPRGNDSFLPIDRYPYRYWRARRPRGERVVELAVGRAVPDLEAFVVRVHRVNPAGADMVVFEQPASAREAVSEHKPSSGAGSEPGATDPRDARRG
ncbi:DUF7002 family protein [Rhizosaccharibacter radicis]|uniref:Uncharacterized protein n=1 Tax=Rhizosaccharibacter radicis TaxID=2782605 RepID=A0ABT1VYV0_9PROT|nr:hypothetical protein [Acetobacteraceae bacterium KSS12]